MKRQRVLLLHYSQSGQLTRILDSLLRPLADQPDIEIVRQSIVPTRPFPFPWGVFPFLDAMPEAVAQAPQPLQPIGAEGPFDLAILGYQPWFLSLSTPTSSFLQSPQAELLRGVPVVTVIGARNMWLAAQEQLKAHLARLGSRVVLNLPFIDRAPNAVSVVTIPLWMLTGKRQPLSFLPPAGVAEREIAAAAERGTIILDYLRSGAAARGESWGAKHPAEVDARLIPIERRASFVFGKWARLIRRVGGPGATARKPLLLLFMLYLIAAIALLFPLTWLLFQLFRLISPERVQQEADRYARGE